MNGKLQIALCIMVFLCANIRINGAVITSSQNGNWNSASTWDLNRVPANSDTINVNHAVEIPNKATISLNDVDIFVAVSLSMVNQSTLTLNNASTMTLYLNATFSRTTGNGAASIGGTSLMSNGSGVQQTGLATADLNGWSAGTGLPVTLVNFTADQVESYNRIRWTTGSELNNDYFELQRNLNGTWELLEVINGAGTTNQTQHYECKDEDVDNNSIVYYRLKQVDINGEFVYSQIISISHAIVLDDDFTFYQSGATLNISANFGEQDINKLVIVSSEGKLIKEIDLNNFKAENEVKIDLETVPDGWYVLSVISNDNVLNKKILLSKK